MHMPRQAVFTSLQNHSHLQASSRHECVELGIHRNCGHGNRHNTNTSIQSRSSLENKNVHASWTQFPHQSSQNTCVMTGQQPIVFARAKRAGNNFGVPRHSEGRMLLLQSGGGAPLHAFRLNQQIKVIGRHVLEEKFTAHKTNGSPRTKHRTFAVLAHQVCTCAWACDWANMATVFIKQKTICMIRPCWLIMVLC